MVEMGPQPQSFEWPDLERPMVAQPPSPTVLASPAGPAVRWARVPEPSPTPGLSPLGRSPAAAWPPQSPADTAVAATALAAAATARGVAAEAAPGPRAAAGATGGSAVLAALGEFDPERRMELLRHLEGHGTPSA